MFKTPFLLKAFYVALGVLAFAYLSKGFYILFTSRPNFDLYSHWASSQLFANRKNPYDYQSAPIKALRETLIDQWITDHPDVKKGIYRNTYPYPPWGLPLVWILNFAKPNEVPFIFASLSLIGLFSLFYWLKEELRKLKCTTLVLIGALGCSGFYMALGLGQLSILILGVLSLSFLAEAKNQNVASGIFFGLALIKPHIAIPFSLLFIMRNKPSSLLVAFGLFIFLSLIASLVLGMAPIELFQMWFRSAETLSFEDDGFLVPLAELLNRNVTEILWVVAGIVLTIAVGLSYLIRNSSQFSQVVFLSSVARVWTYHSRYDNILMIFLLMGLGSQMLSKGTNAFWFFLVGLTLWLPPGYFIYPREMFLLFEAIWILATIVYLKANGLELAKSIPNARLLTSSTHSAS